MVKNIFVPLCVLSLIYKPLLINSLIFHIGSGFISSPDDDFDDFKSATPTAVNFSMSTPSSVWTTQGNDDFDDFKQAPMPTASTSENANTTIKPPLPQTKLPSLLLNKQTVENKYQVLPTNESKVVSKPPEDLMSPEEDKYSVFRSLQQTEDEDEWGDFSAVGVKQPDVDDSSQSNTPTFPPEFLSNPASMAPPPIKSIHFFSPETNPPKETEDFGDFLHAPVATKPESNFADFANFKEPEFHPVPPTYPEGSRFDEEFGDFASTLPSVPCKSDLGHEFLVRDNISLAESQSVSSLELGTFDGGESKSSLSRQGSIPSLDLKNAGVELADNDEFGEFQSPACVWSSKTPSPAKDLRVNGSGEYFRLTFRTEHQSLRHMARFFKFFGCWLADFWVVLFGLIIMTKYKYKCCILFV